MPATVVVLLGWALAISGALVSVPQAVRLLRTGDVRGLSLTTQVAWVSSWVMWLGYSADIGAWPKFGADFVGLLADVGMTALLMKASHRHGHLRAALPGAVTFTVLGAAVCLGAGWLAGPEGLAGSLTVFDGVSLAPALLAAWRSSSLAGMSVWTWVLRAAVAAGWITYAVAIAHPLAAGWSFIMCPVAVIVSLRIWHDRATHDGTKTPQGAEPATGASSAPACTTAHN